MFIGIICFCLFAMICLAISLYRIENDVVGTSIATLFFSMIMILFSFLVVYLPLEAIFGYYEASPYHIEIVSLSSGSTTSGNFTLGCGSINEVEHYFYYAKRSDGNYVRKQHPVSLSSIKEMEEGDTTIPSINFNINIHKLPKWIGPVLFSPRYSESEYVFVVPHGTIVQRFEL